MRNYREKFDLIEASVRKESSEFNISRALVALSGGADSVTLAYALKQSGIEILALHCNFHLRGEESMRDTIFVENFCKDKGIPLEIKEFDVHTYISSHKGLSLEMACRNLRYHWFEKKLVETGFERIATGHNADDNIETFMINMLRGSGTRGLKGIDSDNGKIWRPLIKFPRIEILNYIERRGLSYVTDSTNLKSDFRRNYLRNKIIPQFKEEWKGFEKAMLRTICNIAKENEIVEYALKKTLPENSVSIDIETILEFPAPLLLIKRFVERVGPFVSTPEEILSSINAKKPHIRRWRLKKGFVILRNNILSIEIGHGEGSAR